MQMPYTFSVSNESKILLRPQLDSKFRRVGGHLSSLPDASYGPQC